METVHIDVKNQRIYLRDFPTELVRRVDRATSYLVQGHRFSPAFRQRRWDGREHLVTYSAKRGYSVPSGLLDDVCAVAEERGYEVLLRDSRRAMGPRIEIFWNKTIVLRDYQKAAVAAFAAHDPYGCSGILKMPIRSGKTKTAAAMIYQRQRRTLFLVPSQMLLHQSRDALADALGVDIGIVGDGSWDERDVTVATIQTVATAARTDNDRYLTMVKRYDMLIFDEAHHLRGASWHAAMMGFDARYRIGLSATAYLDSKTEMSRGVLWLKAACGPIRYEVDMSDLIEAGYLMRQHVELHTVREPDDLENLKWSATLANRAIYANKHRNRKIADIARQKVRAGLRVLIVSNRLNQIAELVDLLDANGIRHGTITGRDSSETRRDRVQWFVDGHYDVLVGTVFGEGIDIPIVECVINAEGGTDWKATVQRQRNMTPAEGKRDAVLVDFMDMTNPYFRRHSRERLKMYRSESAFRIRLID